ncbi:uncharacterized protein N0V89_001351 [Didymosphaeria variabile]|uniref:Alpha/beta hydrolase fold-3 domain-containing protein n=1 Tax=Didymosphaeria variabile TaxID=1932322 RepID=A0A9W9CGK6_9PLEO|nr:uncharacterized protein N0V89_001351 [Didymosphaeria variabile]KAJ4360784.1 hypothetical protein N0V89_001351 [Didymosphaeria variabile]
MSPQKQVKVWDDEKTQALAKMVEKYQGPLEQKLNFLDDHYNSQEPLLNEHNNKKFSDFGFNHHTLYYRKPEKYWNEVGLLVPDDLDLEEEAPIHVFFQGGGFWTGDWTWCPWYLQASLRQAKAQRAVILAVNYPRFPLADINDITRAIDDFWDYFYSTDMINGYKACIGKLALDKEKLLISGESAGGYAAAYSVIRPHEKLKVNALFLRYPMLRHYERVDSWKEQLGYMGRTVNDKKYIEKKVNELWEMVQTIRKEMKDHGLLGRSDDGIFADILKRRVPPYGMLGAFASSWCGTWSNYFGKTTKDERLPDILTQLEQMKDNSQVSGLKKVPALFIYHGKDDTNVSPEVSVTFKQQWERLFENVKGLKINFKMPEGPHGFDYLLDDEFMRDFIKDMTEAWISV